MSISQQGLTAEDVGLIGHKPFAKIKKDGADIVNVASTVGLKGYVDEAMYGASKWAMRGFSVNLQIELKDTPSRVISFCTGGFKSGIFQKPLARSRSSKTTSGWIPKRLLPL